MSLHDQLGFESPLVLMKIGYELREKLSDSLEAPVPGELEPLIERIAEREQPRNVLTLDSSHYRWVEEPSLV